MTTISTNPVNDVILLMAMALTMTARRLGISVVRTDKIDVVELLDVNDMIVLTDLETAHIKHHYWLSYFFS